MEDIREFARSIRGLPLIREKLDLFPVMQQARAQQFVSSNVLTSIGEDAASMAFPPLHSLLVSTDSFQPAFLRANPRGAGYTSVVVSADDIYACGGTPIAFTAAVSYETPELGRELMDGISAGSHAIRAALVRGHTSVGSPLGLVLTMLGKVPHDCYVSAGGAEAGHRLGLILDWAGEPGKNRLHWNTVTTKGSEELLAKRQVIATLAARHMISACKDVSNSGVFGTLLQMCHYSRVGACVDLEALQGSLPPTLLAAGYSLIEFSSMYLTSGFIVAYPAKNESLILEACAAIPPRGTLHFAPLGSLDATQVIKVSDPHQNLALFDLTQS
jgi:selenophosphate synthetase-related protein